MELVSRHLTASELAHFWVEGIDGNPYSPSKHIFYAMRGGYRIELKYPFGLNVCIQPDGEVDLSYREPRHGFEVERVHPPEIWQVFWRKQILPGLRHRSRKATKKPYVVVDVLGFEDNFTPSGGISPSRQS